MVVKYSTIRELHTTSAIEVDHVRTDDNLVDPLTKELAREKGHLWGKPNLKDWRFEEINKFNG